MKQKMTEDEAYNLYDDMLDEVYSSYFESMGGIFATMTPSNVLEKVDKIAYHCGFSDWLDSSDIEVEGF